MKSHRISAVTTAIIAVALLSGAAALDAQTKPWATAYYAGWSQGWTNNGHLPAQAIDFGGVTHIVHFSLVPNSNGTLDPDANSMTTTNSSELLSAAHAAGKKVLISVGGWGSDVGFRGATSSVNRAVFVANLVAFMRTRGYDGIDIDWEVLQSSDGPQYGAFIAALRTALNAVTPRPLLTAATSWEAGVFSGIHQYFDQINIMTYDMSGAWGGWVSWHNAAVYDGGYRFPSSGGAVPSLDGEVNRFMAAGIPAAKLGVGIDFYGYVWSGGSGTPAGGVTEPRQGWSSAPSVQSNVPYYTIMQNYYQSSNYRWDASAQAAYLSIDNAGSSADKFISYDDQTSVKKKFEYARSKGIGGLIIWELGGGYRPEMPAGQRDLLLQAVKTELGGGVVSPPAPADTSKPVLAFTAPAAGSTVSGAVSISVNASDNVGVAGVTITVDGVGTGSEITLSPYVISWSSLPATNGVHQLSATARDAAGNRTTVQRSFTVYNAIVSPPPSPPPAAGDLQAYGDALASSWINVSWNATIDFSSPERAYEGTRSMKITQGAWGGVSLHSGSWASPVTINPSGYTAVEFAVFPVSEAIRVGVRLENDQGASFPEIARGPFPAGVWTVVSVPMDQVNPGRQGIHRIDIMESSGTTKTFHLDRIRFTGGSTPPPPPPPSPVLTAPVLLTPQNGMRNLPTSVTVGWTPVAGAATYRVQLSYRSDFASFIADRPNLTTASYTVGSLARYRTIYWRVAAAGTGGTAGPWSSVWNFRTASANGLAPGQEVSEAGDTDDGDGSLSADIPAEYELSQNYPNPFNPSTTIAFALPEDAEVTLTIYNLLGEEMATLVSGARTAGRHEAVWDAADVAGGFYVYRLKAGNYIETRKMLLIK